MCVFELISMSARACACALYDSLLHLDISLRSCVCARASVFARVYVRACVCKCLCMCARVGVSVCLS